MPVSSRIWVVLILAGWFCIGGSPASTANSDDTLVTYMERHQRLGEKDVEGRKALAEWCGRNSLLEQQADLLSEVLKLRPGDQGAYRELLAADAKRTRPVDKQWAEKLDVLLGSGYRLQHTRHFTLLTNTDEEAAELQAAAMEDAYAVFYRESGVIGLRPMPPEGRLVCILFERYEEYRDYLQRHEATNAGWASGHYSSKTNRVAFFHDRDSPAFAEIRKQIANIEKRIGELRTEMAVSTRTARRIEIQQQLKELNAAATDMSRRLAAAGKLATLGKTRHEATHQLLYNSGLLRQGKEYPFWLNEGLACCFELGDADGQTGPTVVNRYRLRTYRGVEQAGKLMGLAELIERQPGEDDPVEQVAGDYAQAWGLAHFLWNKRAEGLKRYMEGLDEAGKGVDLFRRCFGEDLSELGREIRRYIEGM